MDSELLYTIKKAFEYYDLMNQNFLKKNPQKGNLSAMTNHIVFGEEKYKYEFLGMFDKNTNIWIWAYALPILNDELKQQIESLHLYGLNKKQYPCKKKKKL